MSAQQPTASTQRGRTPTYIYTALTAALVVLIAAVAVTAASSSPPSIAEYAPQSIQQIKKAPNNQSGAFGNPGGDSIPTASPSPSPSASVSAPPPPPNQVVDRNFTCVGNPPRQIDDPQSPPCIAGWQGNNGGATTKGVTGSEIRVFVPEVADPEHTYPRVTKDLETFFNERFEFYGRKLNLEPQAAGGSKEPTADSNCSEIEAQGDWVAKELDVFAATDDGSDSCWYDGLARNKVMAISGQTTENQTEQARLAPYIWGYPMEGEELFTNTAHFLCTQLNGGKAIYAPDAVLSKSNRVYGLINSSTLSQFPTPTAGMDKVLQSCGISFKKRVVLEASGSDSGTGGQDSDSQLTQSAQNAVLQMRTAGVTTLVCFCQLQAALAISTNMSTQDYYPEIVAERSDQNILQEGWVANERRGMFEVSGMPKQLVPEQTSFLEALNSVDPGFCPCSNSITYTYSSALYGELLLLASGIQMAGPDLTPATFAAQLHATVFPNPPSTLAEGNVSFAGDRYAMIDDVIAAFWSNAGHSPNQVDPSGAWCYLDDSKRFNVNDWPTQSFLPPDLSTARCDSGKGG